VRGFPLALFAADMDAIAALLRGCKASSFAFCDQKEFVVASTESSTRDAFNLISTKGIDAIPVWSAAESRWVGFLDLKDFMKHLGEEDRDAVVDGFGSEAVAAPSPRSARAIAMQCTPPMLWTPARMRTGCWRCGRRRFRR
jgi:hypothetical protein